MDERDDVVLEPKMVFGSIQLYKHRLLTPLRYGHQSLLDIKVLSCPPGTGCHQTECYQIEPYKTEILP